MTLYRYYDIINLFVLTLICITQETLDFMNKCSIIVPLYRGKDYIEECIESVINQTYVNWELILMNDGSPDDTYEFVKKIIDKYPSDKYNIRLLTQENKGVAETRNLFVTIATGEYVAFLDQDDRFKEDYLERLMGAVTDAKEDIVLCGYERRTDENKVTKRITVTEDSLSKYRIITPWARIYRRDFLLDNSLKFLTTACCEDFYLTIHAYAITKNIGIVRNYTGYIWRYNKVSVSNTKQKNVMIVDAVISTYEKIVSELPNGRISSFEEEEYCFVRSCIYYLLYATNYEKTEQIDYAYDCYANFLNRYYPNYKKNKYISLFRPRCEEQIVRCMVWGFVFLQRLGLARSFIKLWCRLKRSK